MPRLELTGEAKDDLAEVWHYIALDNYEYADRVAFEIAGKLKFLSRNPKAGVKRDDLISGMRQFPFKNDNIFYFPIEYGVEIYRVLHSSRDQVQVFDSPIDDNDS